MKSFSQFIIEKKGYVPLNPDEKAAERSIIKNFNKKNKKKDNRPFADPDEVKTTNRPQSTKDTMAKNIATQDIEKSSGRESGRIGSEGSGKVKDTVKPEQAKGYKPKPGSQKLPEYPGGSEVTSNKAQKKPLGKLVGRVTPDRKARGLKIGDIDRKDSKQLEAQRKARIDTRRNLPSGQPNPKYGKATQKGVENFAQNRGGYGRGRKLSKTEWEKIEGSAKKISSDPSSKAYKDIEAKINKNRDYGGKRAQVMNPKQVAQVKKEKDKFLSKNRKGGKLTIDRTSRLLDTKTRKGRIANVPVNKAQVYTKKINDARLEKEANKVIEKLRRVRKNEKSGLKSRMSNAYVNRQRKLKNSANEILKSINKDSKSSSTFKYKSPPTVNPDLGKSKVTQSVKGPGSYTGSLRRGNLRFSGDANYQKLKKTIDPVKTKTNNTTGSRKTFKNMQKDMVSSKSPVSTPIKQQGYLSGEKIKTRAASTAYQIKRLATKVPKLGVDPFSGAFEYARQRDQKNATPKRAIAGGTINAISSYAGFKKGASTAAKIASPLLAAPFPGARPLYGLTVLGGGIGGQVLITKATQTAFDQALGKKGTRVTTKTQNKIEKEKNKTKTKVITANQGKGKNTKAVVPPTSKGSGGFGLNLAK